MLNLGNTCNISFGPFGGFDNVPVFLTAFCAFALGLLCAIPLSISFRLRKRARQSKFSSPSERKSGIRRGRTAFDEVPEGSPYQDENSYGID
jgi:hypothetical protein